MSEWRKYPRKGYVEARPYVAGESLRDISVSDSDSYMTPMGGWVARNPNNHADQWFISAEYFAKYFDEPSDQPSE